MWFKDNTPTVIAGPTGWKPDSSCLSCDLTHRPIIPSSLISSIKFLSFANKKTPLLTVPGVAIRGFVVYDTFQWAFTNYASCFWASMVILKHGPTYFDIPFIKIWGLYPLSWSLGGLLMASPDGVRQKWCYVIAMASQKGSWCFCLVLCSAHSGGSRPSCEKSRSPETTIHEGFYVGRLVNSPLWAPS